MRHLRSIGVKINLLHSQLIGLASCVWTVNRPTGHTPDQWRYSSYFSGFTCSFITVILTYTTKWKKKMNTFRYCKSVRNRYEKHSHSFERRDFWKKETETGRLLREKIKFYYFLNRPILGILSTPFLELKHQCYQDHFIVTIVFHAMVQIWIELLVTYSGYFSSHILGKFIIIFQVVSSFS